MTCHGPVGVSDATGTDRVLAIRLLRSRTRKEGFDRAQAIRQLVTTFAG
jgi:hypothetical protein